MKYSWIFSEYSWNILRIFCIKAQWSALVSKQEKYCSNVQTHISFFLTADWWFHKAVRSGKGKGVFCPTLGLQKQEKPPRFFIRLYMLQEMFWLDVTIYRTLEVLRLSPPCPLIVIHNNKNTLPIADTDQIRETCKNKTVFNCHSVWW